MITDWRTKEIKENLGGEIFGVYESLFWIDYGRLEYGVLWETKEMHEDKWFWKKFKKILNVEIDHNRYVL